MNRADMLFWDAIYFLLAAKGRPVGKHGRVVEVTNSMLISLTGISERALSKMRLKLYEQEYPYRVQEEEGSGQVRHSYTLVHETYSQAIQAKVIRKPFSLFEQGWIRTINEAQRSRLPIAILNRMLTYAPKGYVVSFAELLERVQIAGKNRMQGKKLDKARFESGLQVMRKLGLVTVDQDDVVKLHYDRLFLSPKQVLAMQASADPATFEPLLQLQKQNPILAAQVCQLIEAAPLDLEDSFDGIVRDLQHVHSEHEFAKLVRVTARYRRRLVRWSVIWKAFGRARSSQAQTQRSSRDKLRFRNVLQQSKSYQFAIGQAPLQWARLMFWLSDPDFFMQYVHSFKVQVCQESQSIWSRHFTEEETSIRCNLTRFVARRSMIDVIVTAEADRELPNISLDIQLQVSFFNSI